MLRPSSTDSRGEVECSAHGAVHVGALAESAGGEGQVAARAGPHGWSILSASRMRPSLYSCLAMLAVVVGLPIVSVIALMRQPPQPLPMDAGASQFSAARAAVYVHSMARAPHPLGSLEHDRVRDYLIGGQCCKNG